MGRDLKNFKLDCSLQIFEELYRLLSKFPRSCKFKCLKVSYNCSVTISHSLPKQVHAAIFSLCEMLWFWETVIASC